MEDYIKILETQNEELKDKLAAAETYIKYHTRKKGSYPVFKIFRVKIKRNCWILHDEFLTTCDKPESIKPILQYALKYHKEDGEEDLVGFQYWRQPINYKWALAGMSRYFDIKLNVVPHIKIEEKTGFITYFY